MSAIEVDLVSRRYQARLEASLDADEIACYDAYRGRIQRQIALSDITPVEVSAMEQLVLDKITMDRQAAALDRQFLALIRVELLPQ